MGTSNDKAARRVKVEDGLLVQVLLGDNRLDDMFLKIGGDLVITDSLVVLCGNEDSVDTDRNHSTVFIVILNSNLCLAVWSQPSTGTVLPNLGKTSTKFGCKDMAQRHKLRSFISSITKHMTLITSTNLFGTFREMSMNTLSNIRTLLLNIDQNLTFVSIKTNII
ncbi:hypothetical protein KIW84_030831 [Lathyrus oleraceus]|uniref:Uncharacterized protein n=1 Tax=Pisum sativum TaxID=3888 RepID=A0A9D5AUH1_PEA|nr:hypothetical protein KIW84_030831 [Pisum sativum]